MEQVMPYNKDVLWSWIWELSKFYRFWQRYSYHILKKKTDEKTTHMYLPTWQKHVLGEFPAVRVASTLHCLSVLVLANTALAWQLSLWIRCVLTGTKWQEGNQTVHICAGGFAICVSCRCFFPPNQTASEPLSCGKSKNVVSKGPPAVRFFRMHIKCIIGPVRFCKLNWGMI